MPSTAIEFAKYDPDAHVLTVKYRNGHIYRYIDVPQEEYEGLRSSVSKGRYLNREIKTKYRYVKAG